MFDWLPTWNPPKIDLEWAVKAVLSHNAMGTWVTLITLMLVAMVLNIRGIQLFKTGDYSLFLWAFYGGLINNLVDITDHWTRLWGHPNGRVLHPAWFAIATIIFFYCIGFFIVLLCGNRAIDEARMRRMALTLGLAVSAISHVLEDFLLGWF